MAKTYAWTKDLNAATASLTWADAVDIMAGKSEGNELVAKCAERHDMTPKMIATTRIVEELNGVDEDWIAEGDWTEAGLTPEQIQEEWDSLD